MNQTTKKDDTIKTKNWQEKNRERKYLKAAATKTETKSEEADDSKQVFSNLTFTVAATPAKVQSQYAWATTSTAIPQDTTIKVILTAAGDRMQLSAAATYSAMYTIAIDIPKYKLDILAKKGATLVDQGVKSYPMNAMTLLNHKSHENSNYGSLKKNLNVEINPPYLLVTLSSCNNEYIH